MPRHNLMMFSQLRSDTYMLGCPGKVFPSNVCNLTSYHMHIPITLPCIGSQEYMLCMSKNSNSNWNCCDLVQSMSRCKNHETWIIFSVQSHPVSQSFHSAHIHILLLFLFSPSSPPPLFILPLPPPSSPSSLASRQSPLSPGLGSEPRSSHGG